MKEEELACPYCRNKDITKWGEKHIVTSIYPVIIYKCYSCGREFEVRQIQGCGEQIFCHGDNFPVFNKGEETMKFNRGDKVRVKIDTGIYYEGEILHPNHSENLYWVKYKKGYQDEKDIFKGEQLEKIIELKEKNETILDRNKITAIGKDSNIGNIILRAKNEHKKFQNNGIIPKKNKNDIVNLWIDLWEFLKDKIKENK